MDAPLVSVITPVYNSARTIEETIASVQSQTEQNWEMLILIDRGTTDETAALVDAISSSDARVRLVSVPQGRSVSDARNWGIHFARGRFLAFLDADDLWLPEKLSRQVDEMATRQAGISCTAFRWMNQSGDATGSIVTVPEQITYQTLLAENVMACSTVIWDRERAGEPWMSQRRHEDWLCWLAGVRMGARAIGVPQDLARYRIVQGSRSAAGGKILARWDGLRAEGLGRASSLYWMTKYALRGVTKHLRARPHG